MNIEKLPLEVIHDLFKNLDRNELYGCLYVCKRWYSVIEVIYYRKVTWRTKKMHQLKDQSSAVAEKSQIFRPFPMTKRLEIKDDFYFEMRFSWNCLAYWCTCFAEQEFLFLLSFFPNLECLELVLTNHKMIYLKILCDYCNPDQLPKLEEIITGCDSTERLGVLKFSAYYKFRQSIKRIDFCYNVDLGKNLLKSLYEFNNLQELKIFNQYDPNLTLFHLLKACPNISTLEYTSYYSPSIENLTTVVQSMSEYCKNLKKLYISVPIFDTPYIDFLANHTPKRLNSIHITFTRSDLYGCINAISMDAMLNFCRIVNKINTVYLCFQSTDLIGVNRERRHFKDSKIDLFYKILNALTQERALNKYEADYTNSKAGTTCIYIFNGSKLYYRYPLDYEDYGLPAPSSFFTGSNYQDYDLPIPSFLQVLSKVNEFKFQNEIYHYDKLSKRCLEYVKKFCPQLTVFKVTGSLDLLFKAECRDQLNTSLENMTHILLRRAHYSDDLFDSLIEYFPKIQVLNFTIGSTIVGLNQKIKFKLSQFEHLYTFVIDIGYILQLRYDRIFLQIQDKNNNYTAQYVIRENKFNPISTKFLQKETGIDAPIGAYAIYMDSVPQLKNIEIHINGSPCAKLDLSLVSIVLFNDIYV